jgi:GNAT superfamily N-acetyltransferase
MTSPVIAMTAKDIERNTYKSGGLIMFPVQNFKIFDGFSCCNPGDPDQDIDDFIRHDAWRHFQDRVAVTYGLFSADRRADDSPIGFATLQNDSIKLQEKTYAYPQMPAVKIGRFGIRREAQRKTAGTAFLGMIRDFMRQSGNRTGCRYLTLSTYPALVRFYEKNSFTVLNGLPVRPNPKKQLIMYLSLTEKSIQR